MFLFCCIIKNILFKGKNTRSGRHTRDTFTRRSRLRSVALENGGGEGPNASLMAVHSKVFIDGKEPTALCPFLDEAKIATHHPTTQRNNSEDMLPSFQSETGKGAFGNPCPPFCHVGRCCEKGARMGLGSSA